MIEYDRKGRSSQEKHSRNGRLSLLANDISSIIFHCTVDGTIILWNKGAEETFQWTREEAVGRSIVELLVVEGPSKDLKAALDKAAEAGSWFGDLEVRRKDGSSTWVHCSLSSISGPDGGRSFLGMAMNAAARSPTDGPAAERTKQVPNELPAIFDAIPIGLCLLDTELRYVRVNRALAEMDGVPAEEHIGRTIDETIPSLSDQAGRALNRVLETGKPILNVELVGETRAMPGHERTWLSTLVPLKGPDGCISSLAVMMEESTDKRRTINELEEVKTRLMGVLDQLPVALLILDGKTGKVNYANKEVKELFNLPDGAFRDPQGISYRDWDDQWPDGTPILPEESPAARALFNNEVVKNELHRSQTSDGREMWTRVSSAPIRGDDDAILSAAITVTDVTGQINAQNRVLELMESSEVERARLQTVLDTLPIGIIITDRNGEILASNRRNQEIWRGAPERLLESIGGLCAYEMWPLDTGDPVHLDDRPMLKALLEGRTLNGEQYGMRRFDGSVGRVIVSGAPIMSRDGGAIGGVVVIQDVSDLQRIELELSRRAEELTRSNAELQQFAYIASHDLREPLRMISSYLGLLERKYRGRELDEKAEEYIRYATDGSIRMQQMINDLLTYSRIDTAGRAFERTDMNQVLDAVVRNLSVVIEETKATIVYDGLPTIWSDRSQMNQLIQNLVDNAIKYRGKGPPRIEVTAVAKAGRWLFCVKDNGVGVPAIMSERIFQMFQRGYTQEERPGTGIGLAIAKKIVERHGGRIWVESEEGKGATFKFILPERPAEGGRGYAASYMAWGASQPGLDRT